MTQRSEQDREGPTNEVRIVGRLTATPEERTLPSGDVLVTFRVSARRQTTPMSRGSKQTADWVDCVALGGRCRRSVAAWRVGDEVAVEGALRRRFYRTHGGAATRLEVEALSVRRLSRPARDAPP